MRYAICNEHWGNVPFSTVCERAAAAGYEGLELAPFTLKEDPRDLTDADALTLCHTARAHGLEIIGLHWLLTKPSWLHITTPDSLLRKEAAKFGRQMARICAVAGGKVMVWAAPSRAISPRSGSMRMPLPAPRKWFAQ